MQSDTEKDKKTYRSDPMTCGLDALAIYISATERFTPWFLTQRPADSWNQPLTARTLHRVSGVRFIFISPPSHYRNRLHRLEFHGTGQLSAEHIVRTLESVVACDPLTLRIAGFDLTADWIGGSMAQLRASVEVPKKRKLTEYGDWESIYHGTGDDRFLLYDKAKQLQQCVGLEAHEIPLQWARIEHRVQGRYIPEPMKTLGGFLKNAADFAPFSKLRITPTSADIDPARCLDLREMTGVQRRNVMYTLSLIKRDGRAGAKKRLRQEQRSAKAELELADRAMCMMTKLPSIADLNSLYREALLLQLFGSTDSRAIDNNRAQCSESPQQSICLDAI